MDEFAGLVLPAKASYPYFNFKLLDTGAFNVDFIGCTCTASPASVPSALGGAIRPTAPPLDNGHA
jgi:hypothetical protein